MPYWSLSAYLKQKVKKALNYVSQFEVAVAREARRRGYQGVVCGHIHRAEMRDIDGILYCNDGDWVESRTRSWSITTAACNWCIGHRPMRPAASDTAHAYRSLHEDRTGHGCLATPGQRRRHDAGGTV